MRLKDLFGGITGAKALGGAKGTAFKRAHFQWLGNKTPVFIDTTIEDVICNAYQKNGPFYSVVNKIAKTSARIPTKVMDITNGVDEKEEVTSGEGFDKFMQVWNKPNSLQGNYELQRDFLIWFLMQGDAYFNRVAPTGGLNKLQAMELWVMPSNRTLITPNENRQFIDHYELMWNPGVTIDPQLVMHMKTFNPETDFGRFLYGMSPAKAIMLNIMSYNDANTTKAATYQNGGPRAFMKFERDFQKLMEEGGQELDEEGLIKFRSDLAKVSGPENAGILPFTDYGIEVVKVGDSIIDLGIVETQINDKDTILDAYETPNDVFNKSDKGSTFENKREAKKGWYEDVIIPLNDHKASELNAWLLPPFAPKGKKWILEHDYSGIKVLQEDFEKQANAIKNLWQLTPRMVYNIIGQPIPEGMTDDYLDEVFIPFNLQRKSDIEIPPSSNPEQEIEETLKAYGIGLSKN